MLINEVIICFTEEILMKEKLWALIAQNESSLLPISLVITLPFKLIKLYFWVVHKGKCVSSFIQSTIEDVDNDLKINTIGKKDKSEGWHSLKGLFCYNLHVTS